MKISVSIFLWYLVVLGRAGHEVLYKHDYSIGDILPNQLGIMQYDSRELTDYWNVSAHWNSEFASIHNHNYYFMSMKRKCSYAQYLLSPVWCKIQAMVAADEMMTHDTKLKAMLFLDSDAVITVNYSMTQVLSFIRKELNWNYQERPVAFNQDGPGWACKYTMSNNIYPHCLNSGTVFWVKSTISTSILNDWWNSAGEPYDANPFPTKWREKWPWEQAQMYKIYDKYHNNIMKLSFPKLPYLPWTSTKNPKSQYPTDSVEPWCFSHWPGANCFITHFCSSKNQKKKQQETYRLDHNSHTLKPIIYIDEMP